MTAQESFDTFGSPRSEAMAMPSRRWRTRILLPALILLTASAVLLRAAWSSIAPAKNVQGTPVVLAAIEQRATSAGEGMVESAVASTATVQAAGWIEPSPYPVFATALTDGVVEEMLVLEGDRVHKGQPVARLVAADARLGVAKAEADVRRRRAARDAARQEFTTLVGPHRAERVAEAKFAAAEASIAQFAADDAMAKATLAELEDDLARKNTLADGGGVSPSELAKLGFRVNAQRAAVVALVARRSMLEAARAEAAAELDAARQGRELLIRETAALEEAEAELASADAMLREATLRLERTEIKAPIDGVVLARMVSPGMMVSTAAASTEGGRVLSLFDPTRLQVRADVPNADIALVGVGQSTEVRVEALPDTVLHGEILRITSQADIAKNTVQVKVLLKDPPAELRPDMLCRVKIHAGRQTGSAPSATGAIGNSAPSGRQRLFVPKALVRDGHVVIAGPLRDGVGRTEIRTVTLGREERDGWIEVTDGVRPGDIVLDPQQVSDGDRVRVTVRRDGGTT